MSGVAGMVREGPWMADRRLFLANGFEIVDTAPPDYELLASKFDRCADAPSFRRKSSGAPYGRGLTIIRSAQCPHIAKFASDIAETAESEYHVQPTVVDLKSLSDAQQSPTPYAVFAILYNGELLSWTRSARNRSLTRAARKD